ncbi:hypothetical protein FRUB_07184 [Fimbriiglobus ruber]|uniref:Knr4/Smi1-like domain-containing protein n=1 Tax=Fimbriiglobus ruber TaxID=1908690 RepID=A0A225DEI9_9BACT|nr:hypothetical protein FRUB_07184 [Fimbriiglobus ruber]
MLAAITGRTSSTHGYPLRMVEAAEARLGFAIPEALRDYYLSVGRHELNRVHNRLWSPGDLEVSHGRLVFLEENQCVIYWGVRRRTTSADPVVFQTMDLDDGEWVAEVRCSLFLPAMLCWYAASGSMPHMGYTDQLPHVTARRMVRGWPPVGRSSVHSAYIRDGQVVCIEESGGDAVVRIGTRNRRDFDTLVSEFAVGVHEA